MPPPDELTSLSAIGGNANHGAVAFATTHWSVVLEAQGESPAAQEALEKLCRTYWRPIYGFVRRQGSKPEEAEDLTQGFFALILERKDLNIVRKEKGRLRSYLLTSVKHFLADESRHAMAVKRGKGQRLIPLDDIRERERVDVERSDRLTADQNEEDAHGRTGPAFASRDRERVRHDRERGQAGLLSISPALPNLVARRDLPHGCNAQRYRR